MMNVLKFFHVLFVFTWIGTLLTLTRLFVYHVKENAEVQSHLAKIYKKFYFLVDFPSMILAVGLGLTLAFLKEDLNWKAAWLHMKLTWTAFLIICDFVTMGQVIKLQKKTVSGKGIGFKILHGSVGLFLILILITIYIIKKKNGA